MENMEPIDSKTVAAPVSNPGGKTEILPPKGLGPKELRNAGMQDTSDGECWLQILFHASWLVACAAVVKVCYSEGYFCLLLMAELPFALGMSFLFNAFHEMVHNTAFRTPSCNTFFAHLLGFVTFRGAKWFWCFHWAHHRFTNDPAKDPELSGGSLDLDDPTRSLVGYVSFLSGYPFGFERVVGMLKMALGQRVDPWVAGKPEATQRQVRMEAGLYFVGYMLLMVAAISKPYIIGIPMVLYWILPHCLGAGHLRMYQFAEHRACQMGPYTDTNSWACARTTATWWLYRKLAWQMPYHIEHHANPNVPFHKLQSVHELVKSAYGGEGVKEIPSGCDPNGKFGYVHLHTTMFGRMIQNVMAAPAA